jgi:hypothetical protein
MKKAKKRISRKPEVICLCGSTRFMDEFRKQNLRLTLEGKIVLSVGCDTKSDDQLELSENDKNRLDELHLRKIDLADKVLILNVDGYVGASTANEIRYAAAMRKRIDFLICREEIIPQDKNECSFCREDLEECECE